MRRITSGSRTKDGAVQRSVVADLQEADGQGQTRDALVVVEAAETIQKSMMIQSKNDGSNELAT